MTNLAENSIMFFADKERNSRAVDLHFAYYKSGMEVILFYGIRIIPNNSVTYNHFNKKVNSPLPMDNDLL